jgi:hypothetical protein
MGLRFQHVLKLKETTIMFIQIIMAVLLLNETAH